jgi:hypothetical protein
MRVCGLCRKEIEDPDESLYCGHCHAAFHRGCLMEHFYYNRFCPACKEKLSFIDMHVQSLRGPFLNLSGIDSMKS